MLIQTSFETNQDFVETFLSKQMLGSPDNRKQASLKKHNGVLINILKTSGDCRTKSLGSLMLLFFWGGVGHYKPLFRGSKHPLPGPRRHPLRAGG